MRNVTKIGLAIALLLLTVVAAAYGPQIATATGDFYARLETLERMMKIIELNYVDDVDVDALFDDAIEGVLGDLDPHSRYITAEEYRQMQEQYRGDYAGIVVSFELFDGVITVLDPLEGGPSEALGLRPGDQIVEVLVREVVGVRPRDPEPLLEVDPSRQSHRVPACASGTSSGTPS